MKNKTVKALAILLAATTVSMMGGVSAMAADDTATEADAAEETTDDAEAEDGEASDDQAAAETTDDAEAEDGEASDDQAAADNVAALIDKIYVQERTDTTDEDCKAAKEAWDALTDAQKELVEGEEASPEYFGR